jgi:multiple sugar transport system permease protein
MSSLERVEKTAPAFTLSVRQKRFMKSLVYHVFVGLIGLVMIYPILWMVAASFKETSEIWTDVDSLLPKSLHLENFSNGWKGIGGISFTTYYKNSFIYAGFGTLFQVVASAIVAYGFARVDFFGKKLWFTLMLGTLMLPDQVRMIPQYIVFDKLGWINTFYPLLIPRLGGAPFFIFMIVQFIRGIPTELDEAALIDGCSKGGIFFRIILPELKPAIITAAIFSFYWTWDDFMTPFIYLTRPEHHTVSVALRAFSDPTSATDWGAIFAMSSLSLVPVFVIFIFFQRYLVEGIATTGLKG